MKRSAAENKKTDTGGIIRADETVSGRVVGLSEEKIIPAPTTTVARWKTFLTVPSYDGVIGIGFLLVLAALLGILYVMYRFIKEYRARWKQLTSETIRNRAQIEQMTVQIKKLAEDQKYTDHVWVDEIRNMLTTPVPAAPASGTQQVMTAPVPIRHDIINPTPTILTDQDMDRALEDELNELQGSVRSDLPLPDTSAFAKKNIKNDDQEGRVVPVNPAEQI